MDTMVTVHAKTREAAEKLLAELCANNDLLPVAGGRVSQVLGRDDRWMGRAEPRPEREAS
ncbi:hypothetical protein [Streptacidiphilus carbonis]|uniref:hypothetical protein n=1 Tax=Streptacidiphilus carbonis TaxID=105422 RepID=UPI0005AB1D6E|nr:hypothetical protein [Streptacidiphilus carbonis]